MEPMHLIGSKTVQDCRTPYQADCATQALNDRYVHASSTSRITATEEISNSKRHSEELGMRNRAQRVAQPAPGHRARRWAHGHLRGTSRCRLAWAAWERIQGDLSTVLRASGCVDAEGSSNVSILPPASSFRQVLLCCLCQLWCPPGSCAALANTPENLMPQLCAGWSVFCAARSLLHRHCGPNVRSRACCSPQLASHAQGSAQTPSASKSSRIRKWRLYVQAQGAASLNLQFSDTCLTRVS